MKVLGLAIVGLVAVAGMMLYVRFAPVDVAAVHGSRQLYVWDFGEVWDEVVVMPNGASLRVSLAQGKPTDVLGRLDAVAMATPRTYRLAGSLAEGRITWMTRTAFWGFPDFTTAEVRADGLYIYARARYGTHDYGVNAARLRAWLGSLGLGS
jgi:Protein of unknown function (DUF1499)